MIYVYIVSLKELQHVIVFVTMSQKGSLTVIAPRVPPLLGASFTQTSRAASAFEAIESIRSVFPFHSQDSILAGDVNRNPKCHNSDDYACCCIYIYIYIHINWNRYIYHDRSIFIILGEFLTQYISVVSIPYQS